MYANKKSDFPLQFIELIALTQSLKFNGFLSAINSLVNMWNYAETASRYLSKVYSVALQFSSVLVRAYTPQNIKGSTDRTTADRLQAPEVCKL